MALVEYDGSLVFRVKKGIGGELTRNGQLRIFNRRSERNTADLMTKSLTQQVVDRLWSYMHVIKIS